MKTFATVLFALCALPAAAQAPAPGQPGGLRIMVPTISVPKSVEGSLQVTPAQLTTMLAQGAIQARAGQVMTEEDIKALLQEQAQAQMLGCSEMKCALDMSRLAGADLLLRGELGMIGPRLLVNASLVHVKEARVLSVVTRAIAVEQLGTGGLAAVTMGLFGQPGGGGDVAAPPPPPPAPAPPAVPERVVVTAKQWAAETGDAAARATAMGKAAQVVSGVPGFKAVSAEELAAVIQSEAEQQALGNGDPNLMQKVADQLKAPFLVSVDIGKTGDAFVAGAVLLDVVKAEPVNRASIVFKEGKQILDAVEVVTKQLFGIAAQLPAPDADPNRLEARLGALAQEVIAKYRDLPQGGAGLVILPFGESAPETKQRKLGTTLANFMQNAMQTQPGVVVAPTDKVQQLAKSHDLNNPLGLDGTAVQEIGIFLGAQAVLMGSVGDFGTDYVLQARLVKVAGNTTLWSGNAVFPKAKPGELLNRKVVITRSRADALTRAAVPGLAQFTAGPIGIVKGLVFVFPVVFAVVPILVGIGTIVLGALVVSSNSGSGLGLEPLARPYSYTTHGSTAGTYDGNCNSSPGDLSVLIEADRQEQARIKGLCEQAQMAGGGVVGVGIAAIVVAIGVGAIAYGLSFVDAAIFGIKSEEISFEAAQ